MNIVRYIFFWGRNPEFSKLEAEKLLPNAQFVDIFSDYSFCTGISTEELETYKNLAGGVVKIAMVKDELETLDEKVLARILMPEFKKNTRIVFAINSVGNAYPVNSALLEEIKRVLISEGLSCRYLQTKDGKTSAVAIDKEHAIELTIVKSSKGYLVSKTIFIQEYEAWNRREYGRPYSDAKRGMLPIKIARMVANVARRPDRKLLLDPFCGMGSILGEALVSGWNVIGSDISEEVLVRSKKNIEWLASEENLSAGRFKFFLSDATHISKHLKPNSVDAIVTEPYMGSTGIGEGSLSIEKVKNIAKGLEKLYLGCLKDWQIVLKPQGIVVIAIPRFYFSGRVFYVKNVVDRCEMLGYTTKAGPIEYSRPQAKVRREFFVFEKK
ncbi:methyltransferase domain-containing protein [Candidatus Gottesmanbacteria bacterium]|nr:methyltransferase domain-containing protein [Candidatus Gottesmanbacteria bacterium]